MTQNPSPDANLRTPPEPIADIERAIGLRLVALLNAPPPATAQDELRPEFKMIGAGLGRAKTKTCVKGYSCGYTCLTKTKNCRSPLSGQHKTYASFLADAVSSGLALSPHHKAEAIAKGLIAPPPPPKPPSPIRVNQDALDKQRQALIAKHGQQLVDDAEKNLKGILASDDTGVFVRLKGTAALEDVLGDRFKNNVELGVTQHTIPRLQDDLVTARKRVEELVLGIDQNTPDADRPLVGYMGNANDLNGRSHKDAADSFGSIAIKLHNDVKERVTVTGSDSFKSGYASEAGAPNAASLVPLTRHGYERENLPSNYPNGYKSDSDDGDILKTTAVVKDLDSYANGYSARGNVLMEAQIHGQVKPSDIAEIHFTPTGLNDRPSDKVLQFAQANNVKVFINGKEYDPNAPKPANQVAEIQKALLVGDIDTVSAIASQITDRAKQLEQNYRNNPSPTSSKDPDFTLSAMFEQNGFDGLPKIVQPSEITKDWQDGGTLMVRAFRRGTAQTDQFMKGEYFVSDFSYNAYGSGTYTSAADGSNAAAASRAFEAIRKNNFAKPGLAIIRTSYDKDAVIVSEPQLKKDYLAAQASVESWRQKREQEIQQKHGAASMQDYNDYRAERSAIEQEYKSILQKTGSVQSTASTPIGSSWPYPHKVHEFVVPIARGKTSASGLPPVSFNVVEGAYSHKFYVENPARPGDYAEGRTAAAAARAAIAAGYHIDTATLKRTNRTAVPRPGTLTPAGTQALRDLKAEHARVENVLYGDKDGGYSSGRLGAVMGYDAIRLTQSYEAKNFVLALNRSKMSVQEELIDYYTASKQLADGVK